MGKTIRISLLHGSFVPDNVEQNITRIEQLLTRALVFQPDLIITPELAVSGYGFSAIIGSTWIRRDWQRIVQHFRVLARTHTVGLILGCPTYDPQQDRYHNSAILIDQNGRIAGMHHKLRVIPGSESWSNPGPATVMPIPWRDYRIGMMICADAYTDHITNQLAAAQADVIISPSAWAPGPYGPAGEWEARSQETGLPIIVCNRSGREHSLDFSGSASVIVADGTRIVSYTDPNEAVLTIDLHAQTWMPWQNKFRIVHST
jgi:predicted amidohydrolase